MGRRPSGSVGQRLREGACAQRVVSRGGKGRVHNALCGGNSRSVMTLDARVAQTMGLLGDVAAGCQLGHIGRGLLVTCNSFCFVACIIA